MLFLKNSFLYVALFMILPICSLGKDIQPLKTTFYSYGQKFTLVTPQQKSKDSRLPLMVLLHGCHTNSDDVLAITDFAKLAAQYNFMILAPEQPVALNLDSCWNWFKYYNQSNLLGPGELNNIKLAIDYVVNTRAIQTERIVAVGFSSGAAMAANLFYCYPQTFSGLALHSGLAFKSATGLTEAEDVLLTGSPKSSSTLAFDAFNCDSPRQENLSFKNLVVIHGLADQRVRAINAQQATQQFIGFWDIADDGRFNNSRSLKIKTQKIPDPLFPSLVETTQIDEAAEMTSVSIQNLAHLWAGGSPNKYSEPRALSASNLIVKKLIINKR